MAKKAMIVKSERTPKFAVRQINRCSLCGRNRAFLRRYGICRICLRNLANAGEIPGMTKSSW